MTTFKEMTNFIINEGAADIPHTNKTYLAHAIGVYNDMKAWEANDALCQAAMFHSIYGTEGFQAFTLSLDRRGELRTLIGDRAEKLAYLNCAMDRASFYGAVLNQTAAPYHIKDRLSQEEIELSAQEFDDLCRVHLCDFLEQVARSNIWGLHRDAYRAMADRLGGHALKAYERVFAQEPA